MQKQSKKKIEKSMEFKKYYLSEFQFHDGEVFITFNIVFIDTSKNEITVAISNRGRISVTTYDLLTDGIENIKVVFHMRICNLENKQKITAILQQPILVMKL